MKKYKIGIFGSGVQETHATHKMAQEIGEALAHNKVLVITGACAGIPYEAACAASKNGGEVWGFSQAATLDEQCALVSDTDNFIYTKLSFIPENYEFKNNQN